MTRLSLSSLDSNGGFIPIALTPDGRVEDAIGTDLTAERDKWVVIAPARLRLHPGFQEIVRQEGHRRPDIDLFYGDEVVPGSENVDHDIILKPELDVTLIVADDYVGYPLVVRASAMRRLGGLRPAANTAASYDLVLRALSAGLGIARITKVLAAHDQARPRPDVKDRRAVLRTWLAESASPFDIGDGLVPGTVRLQRRFASFPDVTLLVPTKQKTYRDYRGAAREQSYIIDLLNSIPSTNWPTDKLHIVIGDAHCRTTTATIAQWWRHTRRGAPNLDGTRVDRYPAPSPETTCHATRKSRPSHGTSRGPSTRRA